MSPGAKKKTSFAKLNREARLRERREEKRAKKAARRAVADAAPGHEPGRGAVTDLVSEPTESE